MATCSRKGCNKIAVYPVYGVHYCVMCTWLANRIYMSTYRNKYTPTWNELKALMSIECPSCGVTMRYERNPKNEKREQLATIQHNNDGTLAVICSKCNASHANSKLGDARLSLSNDDKYCPSCETVKKRTTFSKNSSRGDKLTFECTICKSVRERG